MSTQLFISLLFAFATLTGLIVEAIKKVVKKELPYNFVAVLIGLVIGSVGTIVYYILNGIPFITNNVICAIIMGFASALCSMVGYDKLKELIAQFLK